MDNARRTRESPPAGDRSPLPTRRGITSPSIAPAPATISPTRDRLRIGIALAVVTPLGFATKFLLPGWVPDPVGRWCLLYGAAVLYEVFWILVLAWIWPRANAWRVAVIVFLVTGLLECLQLVHVGWLDAIRGTFVGAALLGNGFDVWDFPHYLLGSVIGAILRARLKPRAGVPAA